MIKIDGSQGEGGGQVLRSCLTLSVITGKPFEITNIRAGRKKPGLMAQHLKCVEAATAISSAEIRGASIGSQYLRFIPHELIPNEYCFDIGTAGSTSLVLQTVYLPLALAEKKSKLVITGGTHVSWSPCFHYLMYQWLPELKEIGFDITLKMELAGFYPNGGGKIIAEINPSAQFNSVQKVKRGQLLSIKGISAIANLPESIAVRQQKQAEKRLDREGLRCTIIIEKMPSKWKNTMVLLLAEFENGRGCFTSLGAIGKRAEKVADEAVIELMAYLSSAGCVDKYLADQLVLPLSLVPGKSQFSTSSITNHLQTNIDIIKRYIDVNITVSSDIHNEGIVEISTS